MFSTVSMPCDTLFSYIHGYEIPCYCGIHSNCKYELPKMHLDNEIRVGWQNWLVTNAWHKKVEGQQALELLNRQNSRSAMKKTKCIVQDCLTTGSMSNTKQVKLLIQSLITSCQYFQDNQLGTKEALADCLGTCVWSSQYQTVWTPG